MDQVVNTEQCVVQQEGVVFYFFKKFIYVILFILFFAVILILFIKFGSNFFLEAMRKFNSKDDDGEVEVKRVKRNIEDRVSNIKNREKLIIDLNLFNEINTIETLEDRLYKAELELKKLRTNVASDKDPIIDTPTDPIIDPIIDTPTDPIIDTDMQFQSKKNYKP